jgi:uncharacterized protein (TIGR02186 family)
MRAAAWLIPLLLLSAPARAAEPLIADLTSHLINITTGFSGTNVVLFGTTDGPGDVIVVVRGPLHDAVVRRKTRVAGIWINTRQEVFAGVPSYYAVYSSRALEEIASPAMLARHQIGVANLRFSAIDSVRTPEQLEEFRRALVRGREREGLFADETVGFNFLSDRLFHVSIGVPANVPTGSYLVEIFLVRNKAVVTGQTTPLIVSQAGIDADVYDFANRWALLYGVVAVIGAAMAGWLASLPFRNA